MSPLPDGDHQKRIRITLLFELLLPGDGAVIDRPVLTDAGIKVPEVIWLNPARAHEISGTKPIAPAPDAQAENQDQAIFEQDRACETTIRTLYSQSNYCRDACLSDQRRMAAG
jgi:hypothetical protein